MDGTLELHPQELQGAGAPQWQRPGLKKNQSQKYNYRCCRYLGIDIIDIIDITDMDQINTET